jgi:hypothetical protein
MDKEIQTLSKVINGPQVEQMVMYNVNLQMNGTFTAGKGAQPFNSIKEITSD